MMHLPDSSKTVQISQALIYLTFSAWSSGSGAIQQRGKWNTFWISHSAVWQPEWGEKPPRPFWLLPHLCSGNVGESRRASHFHFRSQYKRERCLGAAGVPGSRKLIGWWMDNNSWSSEWQQIMSRRGYFQETGSPARIAAAARPEPTLVLGVNFRFWGCYVT